MESKTILLINSIVMLVGVIAITTMSFLPHSVKLQEAEAFTQEGVPEEVVQKFKDWAKTYHKQELFGTPELAAYRLQIFYDNYQKIQNHPTSETYTVAENQFMDITNEEFKAIYLGYRGYKPQKKSIYAMMEKEAVKQDLEPVDWSQKGATTPIKNQGQCGSCWSFSTTGSLEGTAKIFGKGLQSFSEQQLVDCSTSYGNNGCNGGLMDNAFKYVKAKGITTEDAYPYTAKDGKCQEFTSAFSISGYQDVKKKLFDSNCSDLQAAVKQQPVSVAVDAEQWQFYSGGVFSNCGKQLDHGVLAVGYDKEGNWKVKNSWGQSWGENGFINLKYGNTCGICNSASYPKI